MVRLICPLLLIFIAVNFSMDFRYALADTISSDNTVKCNNSTWLLTDSEFTKLEDFFHRIDKPWNSDKQFQAHFRALVRAYPSEIRGVDYDQKKLWILMRSGGPILYDDGKKKTTQEMIESPDLEDSLSIPYPLEILPFMNNPDSDPGRIRNDDFLKAVYGDSVSEVKKNLGVVNFCGKKIEFNTANGAAKSLEKVAMKLCPQLSENPGLKPYIDQTGGTFNLRKIAGTNRMSAHSYGIAIDLNPRTGEYWRGYHGDLAGFRRDGFPEEIVAAFEEQGFIWGGKWYHFDLMHFEYRPELLNMARENKTESAPIVMSANKKK